MGWGQCTPSSLLAFSVNGVMLSCDRADIVKDCILCALFLLFTAADGSEVTTAGRVVSPRSIILQHGFEVNR